MSPTTTLRVSQKRGAALLQDGSYYSVGTLMRVGPARYRILGWHHDATKKPEQDTYNIYAFTAAAGDYFPDVEIYAKQVPFNGPLIMRVTRQDGIMFAANEMHRGNYVKKEYPAELFDAFAEARAKRQTYAVRAARASALNDIKAARHLIEQLVADSKRPGPKLVQERYRDMANQLERQFKIQQSQ